MIVLMESIIRGALQRISISRKQGKRPGRRL